MGIPGWAGVARPMEVGPDSRRSWGRSLPLRTPRSGGAARTWILGACAVGCRIPWDRCGKRKMSSENTDLVCKQG